jgi:hypothetical protein
MRLFAPLVAPFLLLTIACGGGSDAESSATTVAATSSQSEPTATSQPRTGNYLLIPKILVDAPIVVKPIGTDGILPSPDSRDETVLYDLSAFQLNAGDPKSGNASMSGYLDVGSGACQKGYVPSPCYAVFGSLSELSVGDDLTVLWQGEEIHYSVATFCWLGAKQSLDKYFANTPSKALTLITAAGSFDQQTRTYSHQLLIRAVTDPSSGAVDCDQTQLQAPPTATPSPETPRNPVSIDSITSPVRPGGEVALSAKSAPLAKCGLSLRRANGIRVLGFQVEANSSGVATFKWRIPDHYPPAIYTVVVGCGAENKSIDLVVN